MSSTTTDGNDINSAAGVETDTAARTRRGNDTTTTAAAAAQPQARWKDDLSIYPSPATIIEALNDKGETTVKKTKNGPQPVTKFKKLETLAKDIYKTICQKYPAAVQKSITRGTQALFKQLNMERKDMDISELDGFFHPYHTNGKVLVIANDPRHSGIALAVDGFQDYVEFVKNKKISSRTHNDGLRLGCILLDPQYRQTVSHLMSKKRDRKDADQTGDPSLHFYEQILKDCFMNKEYIIERPPDKYFDEFPEEERDSWDPNDSSIFAQDRSALWLKETWDPYVCKKYEDALDKWNKQTGGGKGNPTAFQNYCGGDKWLVWLFCTDYDANFLLASSAGGMMPEGLQLESGFEVKINDDEEGGSGVSDIEGSTTDLSRQSSKKKKRTKGSNAAIGTHRAVRQHIRQMQETVKQLTAGRKKDVDNDIEKFAKYTRMMTDTSLLDTLSPSSKEASGKTMEEKRRPILQKWKSSMADDSDEGST